MLAFRFNYIRVPDISRHEHGYYTIILLHAYCYGQKCAVLACFRVMVLYVGVCLCEFVYSYICMDRWKDDFSREKEKVKKQEQKRRYGVQAAEVC